MVNPAISVVVPCRNEGARIAATLDDLARQDVGEPFEVIVADGSDGGASPALTARAAAGSDPFLLRIVANPERIIPAALNRAVSLATGGLVVRVDAHARLPTDYLRRIAAHLRTTSVAVVGPQIFAAPADPSLTARIISWCQNTRLGNGGTPARNSLAALRRVAHTPMSCYHRTVWQQLGGYDEALLSNEDFDFDWRANLAGFAVCSAPDPQYRIIARPSLPALARQRWRYGRWKAAVAWRHPRSLSARQMVPPATFLGVLTIMTACACGALSWWIPGLSLALIPCCALALAASRVQRHDQPTHIDLQRGEIVSGALVAAATYAIIHLVWAAGFCIGLAGGPVRPRLWTAP
jgi:succinoglycan biosynthesis protein ExoA